MMKTMNPHQKRDKDVVSKRQQMQKKRNKYVSKQKITFVNGGCFEDPLNLNSIPLQQCSAENSPSHNADAQPLIPIFRRNNERDPLNLSLPLNEHKQIMKNELAKVAIGMSRKPRHHHRKKKDGHESAPEDGHELEGSRPRSLSLSSKSTIDPVVVSPVNAVRPLRRRTRTVSEGASCSELSGDEVAAPEIKRIKRRINNKYVEKLMQAESSQPEPEKPPARKLPDRAKFQFGNFPRYYGYRNPGQIADPRLSVLAQGKFEFFHRKDVLDIGCNAGHVTLAIAKHFRPHRIVGLDIDGFLIDLARKNLRHCVAETKGEAAASFPKAAKLTYGPLVPQPVDGADRESSMQFPQNVFFSQGNIVLDTDKQVELQCPEYDTILALSVTKWIHLNWGDDGLKRAFQRIYKMLRPGGFFILEPQSLASYKRRRNLTERIKQNFDNITVRPEFFKDYLRYEIGFANFYTLGFSENPVKGFYRPIYVFYKSLEQAPPPPADGTLQQRAPHHPADGTLQQLVPHPPADGTPQQMAPHPPADGAPSFS